MSHSTVIQGEVRNRLSMLPDQSVHMVVTSPPYYGLRAYGTDPQIWGGNPNCKHNWTTVHPPGYRGSDTKPGPLQHDGNKNRENLTSNTCSKCGAWRGELGLEPTPEMYIQHLVEIFREVRRVLRDDGTLWVNIGDSYARNPAKGDRGEYLGLHKNMIDSGCHIASQSRGMEGYKEKDLMEIPSLLAAALRADGAASPETMRVVERIRNSLLSDFDTWDQVPTSTKRTIEVLDEEWLKASKGGWYLRSRIPWIKRNSLPSSVKDRPSSSIEYIFLLSKSKKYYYDYVATMQPSSESYNKDKRPRGQLTQRVGKNRKEYGELTQFRKQDETGNETYTSFNSRYEPNGQGLRFMRDSDFFFRTWQGLLHNEDGEPMTLVVNPRGFKGAHFACFPVQLVEPMILAGTSEMGVCPECGAPWVRVTSKTFIPQQDVVDPAKLVKGSNKGLDESNNWGDTPRGSNTFETNGWQPSCSCNTGEPIPATVLDPFAGSCAAGVACQWHNRDFIGIELKPEYCEIGRKRLKENK